MTDNTDKLFLPTMNCPYQICSSDCNIPPEAAIVILLSRHDKEKQLENLIKVARYYDIKAKEEERNNKSLEATIKRKDEYIQKLLNKIALLYVSLPEK